MFESVDVCSWRSRTKLTFAAGGMLSFLQDTMPATSGANVFLCRLLRRMLTWEPKERVTAAEAMEDRFFELKM